MSGTMTSKQKRESAQGSASSHWCFYAAQSQLTLSSFSLNGSYTKRSASRHGSASVQFHMPRIRTDVIVSASSPYSCEKEKHAVKVPKPFGWRGSCTALVRGSRWTGVKSLRGQWNAGGARSAHLHRSPYFGTDLATAMEKSTSTAVEPRAWLRPCRVNPDLWFGQCMVSYIRLMVSRCDECKSWHEGERFFWR